MIETGIARGGSLILSASILELLGEGEVLGIDIDIRPHNREAIESHPLARRIRMIEGSSLDEAVVAEARRGCARSSASWSSSTRTTRTSTCSAELRAYAPLVTLGQFLVVADTFVEHIPPQEHRPARPWGPGDNPARRCGHGSRRRRGSSRTRS